MKKIFTGILLSSIFFSACGPRDTKPSAQYEEKKSSMKDMEQDSPEKFLKVTGSFRGNIVNQTVVEGDITNNATLITYKNIKLQIVFKDDEGKTIDKEKQVVEDVIKPGSSTDYKIKLSHIKGANTVQVSILDAEVEK